MDDLRGHFFSISNLRSIQFHAIGLSSFFSVNFPSFQKLWCLIAGEHPYTSHFKCGGHCVFQLHWSLDNCLFGTFFNRIVLLNTPPRTLNWSSYLIFPIEKPVLLLQHPWVTNLRLLEVVHPVRRCRYRPKWFRMNPDCHKIQQYRPIDSSNSFRWTSRRQH